jgi:hypothetical protein
MSISDFFRPVLTNAGQIAALSANAGGYSVQISHIAFGDGAYDVRDVDGNELVSARQRETLVNELHRIAAVGAPPTENSLAITGTLEPGAPFDVNEIGFFLSDGTLFAVASAAGQTFYRRSEIISLPMLFVLGFSTLPAGSVTIQIVDGGDDFSVFVAQLLSVQNKFDRVILSAGLDVDPDNPDQLAQAIQALIDAAIDSHVHHTTASINTIDATPAVLLALDIQEGELITLNGIGEGFQAAVVNSDPLIDDIPPDGYPFQLIASARRFGSETTLLGEFGPRLHVGSVHAKGFLAEVQIDKVEHKLQVVVTGAEGANVAWSIDYNIRKRVSL